jgi:hypothetical protein
MPSIPAFCTQCGLAFGSGIVLENSIGVHLEGNTSVCPRCGGVGRVPDGVYNVLGKVVELLTGPETSVEQIRSLQRVLEQARSEDRPRHDIQAAITKAAPELTSLASVLPSTRGELYAFITVLLTLLGLIVASYASLKPSGPTQAEIDAMVTKALAQSTQAPASQNQASPNKRTKPKVGRNEPCRCGSGKKYKRCCLLAGG